MSQDHFERLFSTFTETAFRLESLPRYKIAGSGEEERFKSYLKGKPLPNNEENEWLSSLDEWEKESKTISRLRVLPEHPEPYINFEIEWGYTYNVLHGEEIYLISKKDFESNFNIEPHDFWLFDEKEAIEMIYNNEGAYKTSKLEEKAPKEYKDISRQASEVGVSLKEYLSWKRKNPSKINLPEQ